MTFLYLPFEKWENFPILSSTGRKNKDKYLPFLLGGKRTWEYLVFIIIEIGMDSINPDEKSNKIEPPACMDPKAFCSTLITLI